MKTYLIYIYTIFAGLASLSQAAVIQTPGKIEVAGVLDGSNGVPGVNGDTMDYVTFEVLTTTTVMITSGFGGQMRLLLAQFVGIEEDGKVPFGFIGNPYWLQQTAGPPASFSRVLEPGIYVTSLGTFPRTSYDVFDGYLPVNREGGGFTFGLYAYTIEGDVRALEFREGNLDGTFTITTIPEPSAFLLMSLALVGGWRRRPVSSLAEAPVGSTLHTHVKDGLLVSQIIRQEKK